MPGEKYRAKKSIRKDQGFSLLADIPLANFWLRP
jgi:hypothetical protein